MSEPISPAPPFGLDADPSETLPASAAPAPAPGSSPRLESVERLELAERLSYGLVFQGRTFQASRPRPISLLALHPAFERDPLLLTRLVAQMTAAARLQGPSILAPAAFFRSADGLYAVFDGVAGVSLATGLEHLGRAGLRLSPDAA